MPERRNLLSPPFVDGGEGLLLITGTDGYIVSWHSPKAPAMLDGQIIGRHIDSVLVTGPELGRHFLINTQGARIPVACTSLKLEGSDGSNAGCAYFMDESNSGITITSRTLLSALENSNVIIRRWHGRIEHWSAGCELLYGYTADEAVGQIVQELLHTEYPEPYEQLQEHLRNHNIWRGDLRQRHKNGTPLFVSALMACIDRGPDEPPLVVATHSDITSRLQMQHELESANARLKMMADELERSNEELEEFARIASHDLSAPITSTRWLVELLTTRHGKQLDDEGQRALAQVGISLQRMSDLVEAVLAHAKVGKSAISTLQEADTELAVEVALENLRHDVSTSGAQITYDRLPPLLIGQQPLTQLFQNLLSNAIKYCRPGEPPIIHIGATPLGSLWRISVRDNGMGVDPGWHERIFLPMQRFHSSKIAGSGIGLATCRKIVNRAGGRLWVESEMGAGSTFLFTLPGPVAQN